VETRRALRTVQLLSLPAGAGALAVEGAARRLAGQDRELVATDLRRRNAARTRRVLGGLKGGALKAGQLLSTVEALFPQDPESTWRDALVGLQESNAALPFHDVEPVLRRELGDWQALLPELDPVAAAAASLGQVHRGRWVDGREVAVKVQYPGVREALVADVRTLSAMSRLTAVVARGLSLPPLVAEMRTRLVEELDYEHEARTQTRFAEAFADDPDVRVPRVVHATSRVLVMEWLDGTPLAAVARDGDQTSRDRAAHLYQRFLVSGPERARLLHTDPHPGNFRMLPDGRLGVLDFGSSLEMPDGMPATFGRLISALLSEDHGRCSPAARGALPQAGSRRRRRQAGGLHGAFHRSRTARDVPFLALLVAVGVRAGQRPEKSRVRRRAEARPAGGAPVHAPRVARNGGGPVPIGGRGAGRSGAAALVARFRLRSRTHFPPPVSPGASSATTVYVNSPSTSQVRQWAREHGVPVGDRGRIPADLVARYLAANGRTRPAAAAKARRAPAAPTQRTSSDGVTIGRTVHAKPRWDWAR
jgi:hypothetical protein